MKETQRDSGSHAGREAFTPDQWTRIYLALLVALGIVAFGNGTGGVLVLDDLRCLRDNASLAQWFPPAAAIPSGLHHRWAGRLSFTASYWLFGHQADGTLRGDGFHLANIGLHLGAGMFLFGVVRRTLRLPAAGAWSRELADALAFAAALLWLVHPLQTAAVTYLVQRLEIIMGLSFLGALYCLVRGAQTTRAWPWYVASVAWCWVGAGSKESIAMLLPVALLYDRAFLAASWREALARRWPVYLGYMGAIVWLLAMLGPTLSPTDDFGAGFGNAQVSAWEHLRTQPLVLLHYLKLTIWPAELVFDYGWPIENNPLRIFLPGAIIVALVLASAAAWWRRPAWGFLGLSFFFALAPTSSFLPLFDAAFEHRMYLPLAPVAVALTLAVAALLERRNVSPGLSRRVGVALLALVTAALVVRTRARNTDYDSAYTLWSKCHASQVARGKVWPRVVVQLARAMQERGQADEAFLLLREAYLAMQGQPQAEFVPLVHSLGLAHYAQGEYEEAARLFERAAQALPNMPAHRVALGRAYAKLGRPGDAERELRQATEVDAFSPQPWQHWGELLHEQGDYVGAEEKCRRALEIAPQRVAPQILLARIQLEQGRIEETLATLGRLPPAARSAVEAATTLADLRATASEARWRNGAEALELARQVVKITQGRSPEAQAALAAALAETGKYAEAAAEQLKVVAELPVNSPRRAAAEQRLKCYQANEPFRRTVQPAKVPAAAPS